MRVLLVEDDADLSATLSASLTRDGLVITVASDGVFALELLSERSFDVLILDRDLPRMSGDSVCREIRSYGDSTPVLMLTALHDVHHRVHGLEMGADDYLTKPFAYDELLARLRALGRRRMTPVESELEFGSIRVFPERGTASIHGRHIRLAPKELNVLEALVRSAGKPLSVEQLLEHAWEAPDAVSRGVVKVAVHSLRQKLGQESITHSPGFGYRLEEN
ncbi:response regulator transcription factor [Leucobacter chromiireducens]|uniref:DNA-binding response regulator n=1 Tax=Leucobacter chromiireducens subsp. chromiireducens TaxID=660067 RepID=A0ABS1SSL1_9MICO|nr:response regulator transcription factor [Leucobacter chromiireducens]MBL3691138.1 DNA-binding response regulator [Leucobacter chromiireducens subsp. chromiireducens]